MNHLKSLYYGGWVAKNIYYLGCSGVIQIGNLRIAGFSGIYAKDDFKRGHHEILISTFAKKDRISSYHVRHLELEKLKLLKQSSDKTAVDIVMSHDWPQGILRNATKAELDNVLSQVRNPQKIRKQVPTHGCAYYNELLDMLQPTYWLAGHEHIQATATKSHRGSNKKTAFRAYTDVPAGSPFTELIEITNLGNISANNLRYDPAWLAIVRLTHPFVERNFRDLPKDLARFEKMGRSLAAEEVWVKDHITAFPEKLKIPPFVKPKMRVGKNNKEERKFEIDPQTIAFLEMLGLKNHLRDESLTKKSLADLIKRAYVEGS